MLAARQGQSVSYQKRCTQPPWQDTHPYPPSPYLGGLVAAAVRDGVNVRIGLSIKDMVQYLELLRCKEFPSHLLPQEVPP